MRIVRKGHMKQFKYMMSLGLVLMMFFCSIKTQAQESVYSELREIEIDLISEYDGFTYITRYNEIMDSYLWILPPINVYQDFEADELDLMFKTVEAETNGGDFQSKVNVANVIFNRLKDDKFPDSLNEVLRQENQFTKPKEEIDEDTILAVECAYVKDFTDGALWFNASGSKSWASRNKKYLFTDEAGHEFYR